MFNVFPAKRVPNSWAENRRLLPPMLPPTGFCNRGSSITSNQLSDFAYFSAIAKIRKQLIENDRTVACDEARVHEPLLLVVPDVLGPLALERVVMRLHRARL